MQNEKCKIPAPASDCAAGHFAFFIFNFAFCRCVTL
jgi:hypothetical protein